MIGQKEITRPKVKGKSYSKSICLSCRQVRQKMKLRAYTKLTVSQENLFTQFWDSKEVHKAYIALHRISNLKLVEVLGIWQILCREKNFHCKSKFILTNHFSNIMSNIHTNI
jgi:hypothetical protein